nr:helix-turn-helix transcriptional regulator [uncultured Dysosmobacter sp.]
MTFGEKLQGLRQRAEMSQDALAEKLNVSRQAVSRWERDETMPETDKVVALAELFGVTTDYLLRDQPEESRGPETVPPSGGEQKRDWVDKLGYLAKTKGYLLGWVLVAWGVLDLLAILLLGLGAISFMRIW